MGMNENFKYLSIGLPGDIERRKQYGDFDGAIRLIDARMEENVPEALKKCMRVERELMRRITDDYPFTKKEALEIIRRDIPSFSDAEFDAFVDGRKIDWIYIEGEPRYFDRFYETLLKVDRAFAERAGRATPKAQEDSESAQDKKYEDAAIADMKANGRTSWRFRIRAGVKIHDDVFIPGRKLRVWLPIPASAKQISDIVINGMSDFPHIIAPETAAQRTICFEAAPTENTEFFVDYSYTNTVSYVDAYHGAGKPGKYDFDLDELQPHVVFSPYIKELVKTLTEGLTDPLLKARAFYDFITKNVQYSYMRDYFGLTQIAENCARNLRGDCGVQALLFITLCRAAGIPAKWQSALAATPASVGAHDWAEFYVEPYGWLFADPSYGGGAVRSGNEPRREFYFGNLDPFRMVANREFQAGFEPDLKYWRGDPYDNQTGEIEYEDGCFPRDCFLRTQQMLEYKKLF